ncbi:MAG: nucleoside triphosphate pyrophosphohydrolase [Oscillospiraceae bacterium]|nr:nucleoside triphosphate pyrophosphohydrolase [Oscillospiraceae bacterium]
MINFPGKPQYDVDDLRRVMEILRSEDGCPWDRVQTHESLRRNLLEECDELCEAIDRGDPELLREELGDVLLQVVFHARIEEEQGRFDLNDVADGECRKLISRHTHVFGDETYATLEDQLNGWEAIKRSEKHQRTPAEAMDAVCRTLPGLWRAEKIQKKGAPVSDRTDESEIFAALESSLAALRTAADPEGRKAALGELLFDAVYAARHLGLDPEEALHARCEEQIRRFRVREAESGQ